MQVDPAVSLTCAFMGMMVFLWVIDYVVEDRKRRRNEALLRRMSQNFNNDKDGETGGQTWAKTPKT